MVATKKAGTKKLTTPPAKRTRAKTQAAKIDPPIDWMARGAERASDRPDAPSAVLAQHAEKTARRVLARKTDLAKGKVYPRDAAQLKELAAALRSAETRWRNFWIGTRRTPVSKARHDAMEGRNDLVSALRTYAKDQATQDTLTDIGRVDGDADLQEDLDRLLAIARDKKVELAGTDVDEARVDEIAEAAARFTSALAGLSTQSDAGSDPTNTETQQEEEAARTVEGNRLRGERNKHFWALSGLSRYVIERAQHVYRRDEVALTEFAAYTFTATSRTKKPEAAKPAEPVKEPTEGEPAPQEPAGEKPAGKKASAKK